MKNKGMTKYSKTIISLVMAFAMLILTTTTTFAWVAVKNDLDLSFTAGGGADIVLYYATYDKALQDYVWSEGNDLSSDKAFGNKFETKNSPLHLGQIENLQYRKKENVSWFALKVKTNGNQYFKELRMSFDTDKPVIIYTDINNNPTDINDINNPSDPQNDKGSLIQEDIKKQVEKLIVVDNFNVTEKDLNAFKTDIIPTIDVRTEKADKLPVACYVPKDTTTNVDLLQYQGKYTGESEYYYIYFRVLPMLDAYGDFARYIAKYLPCVLTFMIQINITTQSVEITK